MNIYQVKATVISIYEDTPEKEQIWEDIEARSAFDAAATAQFLVGAEHRLELVRIQTTETNAMPKR